MMYRLCLNQFYLLVQQNSLEAGFSPEHEIPKYCINVMMMPIILGWFVLLGLFIWAISVAFKEGVIRLKRLHQVPCDRCAYFTGNMYLKCAVHPCRALTEDAVDCIDFEPTVSPINYYATPCQLNKVRHRRNLEHSTNQ